GFFLHSHAMGRYTRSWFVLLSFIKGTILLVGYRFQPLVGTTFCRNFNGDMGKPFVPCRTVPVLNLRGNVYHVPGMELSGRLLPFLIPALAIGAQQNLPALMVDMPVVAALRFKGYIVYPDAMDVQGFQIAVASKIPVIRFVGFTQAEQRVG